MKRPGVSPLHGSNTLDAVWLGLVPYQEAMEIQRRIHAEVIAGQRSHTLLLLEHPPVYTLGRRGGREHLHLSPEEVRRRGAEVVETDRGGLITFHGPGQLVAYPIIQLGPRRSLNWYIQCLLDATAATANALGVEDAVVDHDRPGVWVGPRKLASVGVRLTLGATLHGVALNLDVDPAWFRDLSPCGLDVTATSLVAEGAQPVNAANAGARLYAFLAAALGFERGSDCLEKT